MHAVLLSGPGRSEALVHLAGGEKPWRLAALWDIPHMGYGRLVSVTAKSPDGGDLRPVVYVVAEGDPAKATKIVGAEVQVNANIEAPGRASAELLNALKLAPGEFIRI